MPNTSPASQTAMTRWAVFSAVPHRMLFFAGISQVVLIVGLWLIELIGRTGMWWGPLPFTIPATTVHAFLMLYTLFPFFIFGFLVTVYPRWMGGEVVARTNYVSIFWLLVSGVLIFYLGLFTTVLIASVGIGILLLGWGTTIVSLLQVYRRATQRGLHERILNLALISGGLGMASFLLGLFDSTGGYYFIGREIGLWLFLVPAVFSVSHRMIPFFTQSALLNYTMVRPIWGLPVVLGGALGHAVLETSGYGHWTVLFDLPMAAAALYHTLVWDFRRSFEVRLVAMLHIAFLWFGIAMSLYVVQSLLLLITGTDLLGRAPLHALGIGFLTGMIVSMASRVTLGHSGRQLTADNLTWYVLFGINVTAVLRIAAELVPAVALSLNILTALAWLICLAPWVWRYAPMYLRPRVDGQPD